MKKNFVFLVILFLSNQIVAEEAKGYLGETKNILDIEDPNRQAEIWAMCAASYDIMSEVIESEAPARAKQLSDLANGAELAVIISMVAKKINDDLTPEIFANLWTMSKMLGEEMPKTRRTYLLAELESDESKESINFISNLSKTVEVCANNLEAQQMYIDIWRHLATSGLLQLPEK